MGGHLAIIDDDYENEAVYTNWHSGEPNNERGLEHYGMYYWKFKYTWNDGDFGKGTSGGGNAFICEWDF